MQNIFTGGPQRLDRLLAVYTGGYVKLGETGGNLQRGLPPEGIFRICSKRAVSAPRCGAVATSSDPRFGYEQLQYTQNISLFSEGCGGHTKTRDAGHGLV